MQTAPARTGALATQRYQNRPSATVRAVERLLVISNQDAGTAELLDQALAVLRPAADVDVVATSSPDELDDLLRSGSDRTIVVAGGDGSLHAVVAALHRNGQLAGSVLGLIPLGTGNDFARGTGIPLEPREAADVVLAGRARPVDVLLDDTDSVVVNNVHLGIGAEASRKADVWKQRLGRLGYPMGAALAALRPESVRLRVRADGAVIADGQVLQVALGNGSTVGGGTELNPEADPTDGTIDVVVSQAVGPLARLGYALLLRRGRHHRRDDVIHLSAHEVQVSGDPFWCSADGEVDGPVSSRTWRLHRAAYRMVLS